MRSGGKWQYRSHIVLVTATATTTATANARDGKWQVKSHSQLKSELEKV